MQHWGAADWAEVQTSEHENILGSFVFVTPSMLLLQFHSRWVVVWLLGNWPGRWATGSVWRGGRRLPAASPPPPQSRHLHRLQQKHLSQFFSAYAAWIKMTGFTRYDVRWTSHEFYFYTNTYQYPLNFCHKASWKIRLFFKPYKIIIGARLWGKDKVWSCVFFLLFRPLWT